MTLCRRHVLLFTMCAICASDPPLLPILTQLLLMHLTDTRLESRSKSLLQSDSLFQQKLSNFSLWTGVKCDIAIASRIIGKARQPAFACMHFTSPESGAIRWHPLSVRTLHLQSGDSCSGTSCARQFD